MLSAALDLVMRMVWAIICRWCPPLAKLTRSTGWVPTIKGYPSSPQMRTVSNAPRVVKCGWFTYTPKRTNVRRQDICPSILCSATDTNLKRLGVLGWAADWLGAAFISCNTHDYGLLLAWLGQRSCIKALPAAWRLLHLASHLDCKTYNQL